MSIRVLDPGPPVVMEIAGRYVVGVDAALDALPTWRQRLTRRLVDELAQVARELRARRSR